MLGKKINKIYTTLVVGGGVSGVTTAIRLAELEIPILLIEQRASVVSGPPFCHLHAGGNLYPDITVDQCKVLLRQSIAMAQLFPESIDKRPTFISVPKEEEYSPKDIIDRLDVIVEEYQDLIKEDKSNEILGKPEDYYKVYKKEDIQALKNKPLVENPQDLDDWMVPVAHTVDFDQLKFPVLLVNEFGWNLFRLAAQAYLAIEQLKYCDIALNTEVTKITDCSKQEVPYNWIVETNKATYYAQFLVNAAGFKTGELDNDLDLKPERMVEFKAAYLSKWKTNTMLPEMIFHGKRGTKHGMAQLTPYANGYFQIHGMTQDITLFDHGLVKSTTEDAQPRLEKDFQDKIDNGWAAEDVKLRTERAINHVAQFVPSFKSAEVGGNPLFGAQQIPGDDVSLRVAEVSFPKKFYARSEIVKASSALDVADKILEKLQTLSLINKHKDIQRRFEVLHSIAGEEINLQAQKFAEERGYSSDLGKLYRYSISKEMK